MLFEVWEIMKLLSYFGTKCVYMYEVLEEKTFSHGYLEEWEAIIRSYLLPPLLPLYIFPVLSLM